MKKVLTLLLVGLASLVYGQKAEDLFSTNDVRITWLGVDFSNVKLIGDFSHFSGIGEKSSSQIKNHYFASWNRLILNEREKYDIRGRLRKDDIFYDIDLVMSRNENAPLADMESYNNPNYTQEDIVKFINEYDVKEKSGIGIVLVAESLNKSETEAYFHFVAINLATKEVLMQQRFRGEPKGFGIRNYWAGAIYDVLEQIGSNYRYWRSESAKK
jgi:hypothetical protein